MSSTEINKQHNKTNKTGSVKKGLVLVALGDISVLFCIIIFGIFVNEFLAYLVIATFSITLLWLLQFIYVIPLAIYFRKEKETLKGILILSGATFLLSFSTYQLFMHIAS